MKSMNKSVGIALGILALALLLAAVIFFIFRREEKPPDAAPASEPETISGEEPVSSAPQEVLPDMQAGETEAAPYEAVSPEALSETTLTETEIVRMVQKTLDGLMKLDPKAAENISVRSTGGDRNPFYYMFAAALENEPLEKMFQQLGGASSYKILRYEVSDRSPNIYTFYLNCSTPFVADIAASLASMENPLYVQEFTRFAASGAAEKIAKTNPSALPKSRDIVALTVIVEDDVPMIYHPVSLNYGNRNPQYAFLWGGISFKGVSEGDLLIENTLGETSEVNREKFLQTEKNATILSFVESGMNELKKGNLNGIETLSIGGATMDDSAFFTSILPAYKKLDENCPVTLETQTKRLNSLEYSCRFFESNADDNEDFVPRTFLQLTYSVLDQDSGGRAYFHTFFVWDKAVNQRMTDKQDGSTFLFKSNTDINDWDGMCITIALSQVMSDAIGGEQNELSYRLALRDAY